MRLRDRADPIAPTDSAARFRVSWGREVAANAAARTVGHAINGRVRGAVAVRVSTWARREARVDIGSFSNVRGSGSVVPAGTRAM